jgi:hypothetical protein
MEAEKLQHLLDFCKLFIDENRLKIIGALAQQSSGVTELAGLLKLKQSLVSRHLARLQEAGLVQVVVQGQQARYQLDFKMLQTLKKELFAFEDTGETAGQSEESVDKILGRFLEGNQLTHIPTNHTKRMVVLDWVVNKFEIGINYPERAINEVLSRHYPDYASLRRALIDYGFMQREKGIYWRTDYKRP